MQCRVCKGEILNESIKCNYCGAKQNLLPYDLFLLKYIPRAWSIWIIYTILTYFARSEEYLSLTIGEFVSGAIFIAMCTALYGYIDRKYPHYKTRIGGWILRIIIIWIIVVLVVGVLLLILSFLGLFD